MNEKGWGISTLIGFLAVFGIFIIIVSILYNKNFSSINTNTTEEEQEIDENEYNTLEDELQSSAEEYIDQKEISDSYKVVLTLSDLDGYLANPLTDPKTGKACNGYVIYQNKRVIPYIQCGSDYQTPEYNDSLQ